ncbi:MAG: 4Fe-4S dicluster domain-containing protein [Candidatus Bathyarchaeota archaeon]|nr:4Fe-4S dicluster domain-containing protein [Candidatus Bathyarchaeota archaeon]
MSDQVTKEPKFVGADFEKCTGCSICELVCALQQEKAFDPKLSRIKVLRLQTLVNMPVACRLCEDAPCVRACPRDALKKSDETGVILVDDNKCDLCGWCIESCKHGAIFLNEDKKTVMICNLCEGTPQCIEWCPENALSLMTQKEFDQQARKATVNKLIPDGWR